MKRARLIIGGVAALALVAVVLWTNAEADQGVDAERRFWLTNAIVDHGFTAAEAADAAGVEEAAVVEAIEADALGETARWYADDDRLKVLPYPGGRHPRIGFLDGAIDPWRSTKASVFAPWDARGYVVVDLPEAVFSNVGLTFLAHTHIPTIWDERGVEVTDTPWTRHDDGSMTREHTLPNGVIIGAKIEPRDDGADMQLWLENGSEQALTSLRTQVCVMLKGLPQFNAQTSNNKITRTSLAGAVGADRSRRSRRYVLTAWERTGRAWENPPVPCIHADPVLPDCEPGERVSVRGTLRFYEGEDVERVMEELEAEYAGLE